jgi:hypothetical protein
MKYKYFYSCKIKIYNYKSPKITLRKCFMNHSGSISNKRDADEYFFLENIQNNEHVVDALNILLYSLNVKKKYGSGYSLVKLVN